MCLGVAPLFFLQYNQDCISVEGEPPANTIYINASCTGGNKYKLWLTVGAPIRLFTRLELQKWLSSSSGTWHCSSIAHTTHAHTHTHTQRMAPISSRCGFTLGQGGSNCLAPKFLLTAAVCSSKTSKQLYRGAFWTVGVVDLVVLACVLRATTRKRSSAFCLAPPPIFYSRTAPDQQTNTGMSATAL